MSGSIVFTLLELAKEYTMGGLNDLEISPEIIQQTTEDGIEFSFVKVNIRDYKLSPMETVDSNGNYKSSTQSYSDSKISVS